MIFKRKKYSKNQRNLTDDFRDSLMSLKDYSIESKYSSGAGPLSLFAMSSIKTTYKEKYEAIRLIERKNENFLTGLLYGGGVFIFKNLDYSKELIKFIPKAEDPRVFEFNKEYYVYYQIFNIELGHTEIFLTEISCENNRTFKVRNDDIFHGKNWSPFEIDGILYFVHTYDPFFILEIPLKSEWVNGEIYAKIKNDSEVPKWEWSDDIERGFVTEYRGGTPGIEIDKYIYFFGHRTHKKNQLKHSIFVARFNKNENTIDFHDLNNTPDFDLISDPYGVNIHGNNIEIDITLSKGFAGSPNAITELITLKFHMSELDNMFKNISFTRRTNYTFAS